MWSLVDVILKVLGFGHLAGHLHPVASLGILFTLTVAVYAIGTAMASYMGGDKMDCSGEVGLI